MRMWRQPRPSVMPPRRTPRQCAPPPMQSLQRATLVWPLCQRTTTETTSVLVRLRRRFSRTRFLAFLLLGLMQIACCFASPARAEVKLSYFLQNNGKTQWMLWSASNGQTVSLTEVPDVPSHVFWEKDVRFADFLVKNDVYRVSLGNQPAVPEKISSLPTSFGRSALCGAIRPPGNCAPSQCSASRRTKSSQKAPNGFIV